MYIIYCRTLGIIAKGEFVFHPYLSAGFICEGKKVYNEITGASNVSVPSLDYLHPFCYNMNAVERCCSPTPDMKVAFLLVWAFPDSPTWQWHWLVLITSDELPMQVWNSSSIVFKSPSSIFSCDIVRYINKDSSSATSRLKFFFIHWPTLTSIQQTGTNFSTDLSVPWWCMLMILFWLVLSCRHEVDICGFAQNCQDNYGLSVINLSFRMKCLLYHLLLKNPSCAALLFLTHKSEP